MTRSEAKQVLKQLYARALGGEVSAATLPDRDLIHGAGVDSIAALEILILTEQQFAITVEDEDLSPALVDDLDALIDYVNRRAPGTVSPDA